MLGETDSCDHQKFLHNCHRVKTASRPGINCIRVYVFVSRQGTVRGHKLSHLLCVSKLKFHVKPQLFLFQRKHFRAYLSPLWGWLKQQEKNFMHTWIYFREQIICEQPSCWVRFEGSWSLSRIASAFISENCRIHIIFSMERIVSLWRLLFDFFVALKKQ